MSRWAVIRDGRVVRVLERPGRGVVRGEVREVPDAVRRGYRVGPGGELLPPPAPANVGAPRTELRRSRAAGAGLAVTLLAIAALVAAAVFTVREHHEEAPSAAPVYEGDTGEAPWSSSWGRP